MMGTAYKEVDWYGREVDHSDVESQHEDDSGKEEDEEHDGESQDGEAKALQNGKAPTQGAATSKENKNAGAQKSKKAADGKLEHLALEHKKKFSKFSRCVVQLMPASHPGDSKLCHDRPMQVLSFPTWPP